MTCLVEQSQRPVAGAVVLLRVVEGAAAHQCHVHVGLLLGAKEDVDCFFFELWCWIVCDPHGDLLQVASGSVQFTHIF